MPSPLLILAFSYIRFSHPDQAKGDSVRRQDEAAASWCKRNGVTLDTSITLHDLGKSAYTGKHRQNPDRHALAAFLKLVESGKVPRGSCLIIENLDRLTREHLQPALLLVLNLLQGGIRIVQLKPAEMVFDDQSDTMPVMMMIMELARGHGESAMKSERNGAAWEQRRRKARARADILTHRLPAWVEERGGKLAALPGPAAAVKHIFELAAGGYGAAGIVKKLTADKVPPFGVSGRWTRTYVVLILQDRRALGELQPRRSNGKPDGEALRDYFPVIVTEDDWNAARAGAAQRRRRKGKGRRWTDAEDELARTLPLAEAAERMGRSIPSVRARRSALGARGRKVKKKQPRENYVNVFSGLLKDAHDGGSYYVATRSSARYGTRWRVLLNVNSAEGRAPARSFPFETFECAVLSLLREIDPQDILNGDSGPDESLVLAGQLARVEAKIAELEAELLNGDVAALAKVLRQLEEQKRDLEARLAEARQNAAHPLSMAWGEAQSLVEAIDGAPDPNDVRLRLRAALRRMIDGVWLLVVPRGRDRLVAVQVWFAGRKKHRDYVILNRPAKSDGRGRATVGGWWARALATAGMPDDLDLRKRKDAKDLEAALSKADAKEMQAAFSERD
jgi:DNA invertase Pin-like site-specific DNA recombinase